MTHPRVALIDDTPAGGPALELSRALGEAGVDVQLIGPPAITAIEGLLARRGFTPRLTAVPGAVALLARGRFDVAHAFSPAAAAAAHAWRRVTGRPVVFTCTEVLDRGNVANARLRLALLRAAVEDSDAVLAASEPVRAGLDRWMALDPAVPAAADVAVHVDLYRRLLT